MEQKDIKIAFIGMGNVARAFARLLIQKSEQIRDDYRLAWKVTGIATGRHGCVIRADGLDLESCVNAIEVGSNLDIVQGCENVVDTIQMLDQCGADLVFETSPLNPIDGQPAIGLIGSALAKGAHVVTANKGPVAFAYNELREVAAHHGVQFRFEGSVMDGTPVFNLAEFCLPGVKVLGFAGVLNSTTNIILSGMELGRSFSECLAEAQQAGIAEQNADYDIDGWDAAVKAVALATVLMGGQVTPGEVDRKGIREVTASELTNAAGAGNVIKLIARAARLPEGVLLSVAPEVVPRTSALGSVRGTSNVLVLHTDLMGEIAIVETDPTIDQTAYALLSDMIRIYGY